MKLTEEEKLAIIESLIEKNNSLSQHLIKLYDIKDERIFESLKRDTEKKILLNETIINKLNNLTENVI